MELTPNAQGDWVKYLIINELIGLAHGLLHVSLRKATMATYAAQLPDLETTLIEGLKVRDESAFRDLFCRFEERIFRTALRILKEEESARDALQETMINIFRAKVTAEEEGFLVLDITCDAEHIESGMAYVKTFGVTVSEVRGIRWDDTRCTSCGNCVPHCPTDALAIPDPGTMRVVFDSDECVECLSCITYCPFHACTSLF